MNTNVTHDSIVKYLYNELEIVEKLELENELSQNDSLQKEFNSYKEVVDFMDTCKCNCKPSESLTQSIINKIQQA